MQGGFDLRNGGVQVGAFNVPCHGKAQALTLALGFYACHLFGLLLDVEGGSCSSVRVAHTLVGLTVLVMKLLQVYQLSCMLQIFQILFSFNIQSILIMVSWFRVASLGEV